MAAQQKKYNYPNGEIVWVEYYDFDKNIRFIITSKETREFYFLYEYENGKFRKLGKSKSPKDLEVKFDVESKVNADNKRKEKSE